jgi:hypothetical protein
MIDPVVWIEICSTQDETDESFRRIPWSNRAVLEPGVEGV